jgi:hypothetical protein
LFLEALADGSVTEPFAADTELVNLRVRDAHNDLHQPVCWLERHSSINPCN